MTDRLDTLLREVIHDLAAEGDLVRPEDRDRRRFALDASDRGFQYRNRRRAGLVGLVAIVMALAIGLPYGLSLTRGDERSIDPGASPTSDVTIGPDGVPTHVITDKTRPIELVDGWFVLGNKWVLDWNKKTYRRIGGEGVQVSPNGRWVGAWSLGCAYYRVVDLTTGDTRNYNTALHDYCNGSFGRIDPQWSPDGDRLVFTKPPIGEPAARTLVAVVLDVRTWQTTTTLLDVSELTCAEVDCQLTWLPSGTELAITLAHKGGEHQSPVPFGIQTFTLDGARARSLPIAGVPTGPESWSPDGRYLVVRGPSANGSVEGHLVEVSTGAVVQRMPGFHMQAAWVDNDRILAWELDLTDSGNPTALATLRTRDGLALQRWRTPADITNMLGALPPGPLAARLGA